MSDKAEKIAAANIKRTLQDGPGLRYSTGTFVGAVRGAGDAEEVLIMGLGGMGVGSMWESARGNRSRPGYRKAKKGWTFSFWDGWHSPENPVRHLTDEEVFDALRGMPNGR